MGSAFACHHFLEYLIAKNFILFSDNQALTSVLKATPNNPLYAPSVSRKINYINEIIGEVSYIPGKLNHIADLLSRNIPHFTSKDVKILKNKKNKLKKSNSEDTDITEKNEKEHSNET